MGGCWSGTAIVGVRQNRRSRGGDGLTVGPHPARPVAGTAAAPRWSGGSSWRASAMPLPCTGGGGAGRFLQHRAVAWQRDPGHGQGGAAPGAGPPSACVIPMPSAHAGATGMIEHTEQKGVANPIPWGPAGQERKGTSISSPPPREGVSAVPKEKKMALNPLPPSWQLLLVRPLGGGGATSSSNHWWDGHEQCNQIAGCFCQP